MHFPYHPLTAALLCCLSTATPLAAQEYLDPDRLDTLVVTTSAPSGALTWRTDPKLPRQPVPASDGADYLKTIPGFAVIRQGGSNGDPVLRGMFGSRLNVLSNDGAMAGACPSRMDNPLSYIAPETFDRLVLVKGPQTVLWGPGASAGTLRFERDTPHFDAPTLQLDASALLGSRNRNDQVLDATAGNALGYLRVNGNRSEADDYREGNGATVPSRWRKWNSDFAVGWTPNADSVLELNAGSGDAETRYAGRGMDGAAFRRRSYGLRYEHTGLPGAWESVQASLYHNAADHVMDNYSLRTPNPDSSMPMPMASNVDRRTRGGRIAATASGESVSATFGLDGQDSRHRNRSASGRGAYLSLPRVEDADFRQLGAFTEVNFGHGQPARWIAGLRLDRAEASDHRATAGMTGMPNPSNGQTRRETLRSGFLRHEREIGERWSVYAGLGHSERMPDYWELFSADAGPAGSVNAFSALQPERTTQLDAGFQYRGTTLDAWVSAYAGRIDDYLLFTYTRGGMMGSGSRADNVDARIAGAEAGVEWRVAEGWKFGGSLAHAWGENRSDDTALAQMPPLEARLSTAWEGARWSAGLLLRGVARQHRVSTGQGNVTGRDLGPSAGFATLALNAGYRASDRLRFTAGVDNLFDRFYREHLNLGGSADFGYPAEPVRIAEPGRTFWLKANYRY